jgi:hypothetical protein
MAMEIKKYISTEAWPGEKFYYYRFTLTTKKTMTIS